MSIQQAREHPWIADIYNPPPPGFVGSQEVSRDDDDEDDDYDFARNVTSRAFTEPGSGLNTGSSGEGSFSFGGGHFGGAGNWGQRRSNVNQSVFSSGSSIQVDSRSFNETAGTNDTPSPKELDQCSQGMENLNLKVGATGLPMDLAPLAIKDTVDPMTMDEALEPSPASTKYRPDGQVDTDDSWHVIPGKPRSNRAIKPIPRTSLNNEAPPPNGHLAASAHNSDRSRTPTPGLRSAAPRDIPVPSTTKRKAMDLDDESELSSPPPSDDEYEHSDVPKAKRTAPGIRKKNAKPTSNPKSNAQQNAVASGSRTSNRLRTRQAAGLATPNANPSSNAKRRPANKIKMPTSSDEEDEVMVSPKSKASASTTTRKSTRRNAQPTKAPRYT
jgi:hypothetical protein